MSDQRLQLLEQKLTVLANDFQAMLNEINIVLGDTHGAMSGLANANKIALQMIEVRLQTLERLTKVDTGVAEENTIPTVEVGGKEL